MTEGSSGMRVMMRVVSLAGLLLGISSGSNGVPGGGGGQQNTFPPWTGTANAWTGTANAWTGTANPYNGPVHPNTTAQTSTASSTPSQGEHCYQFQCVGQYEHCFHQHSTNAHVCLRQGQFCKVSVHQHTNGSVTVQAKCVAQDCGDSRAQGPVLSGCCAASLCNDRTLLSMKGWSSAPRLSAPSLLTMMMMMSTLVMAPEVLPLLLVMTMVMVTRMTGV